MEKRKIRLRKEMQERFDKACISAGGLGRLLSGSDAQQTPTLTILSSFQSAQQQAQPSFGFWGQRLSPIDILLGGHTL